MSAAFGSLGGIARRALDRLPFIEEQPVFGQSLPLADGHRCTAPSALCGRMNRDDEKDLLRYRKTEVWQDEPDAFLERAKRRLEAGEHVYTRCAGEELLHYGWVRVSPREFAYPEIQRRAPYTPRQTAVLYDFFSAPRARGRGFYQASLCQILRDVSEIESLRMAYISVGVDNEPSLHVVRKMGFTYRGSILHLRALGLRRRWRVSVACNEC